MSQNQHRAIRNAALAAQGQEVESLRGRLAPRTESLQGPVPRDPDAIAERSRLMGLDALGLEALEAGTGHHSSYGRNIENMVGTVKVPVGLAGPLRVNGTVAHGDYHVPLATTEAALVASYARGSLAITEAGGASVAVVDQGISRSPCFRLPSLVDAGAFAHWVASSLDILRAAAARTTRHGSLLDIDVEIDGSNVYLVCQYDTADAAGQNMATIATQEVCETIVRLCPHEPVRWWVEANASGDKKASARSFLSVRGRRVTAEAVIPPDVVRRRLRTEAQSMREYWEISAVGGIISGTMGVQGHFANGLAALYLATGQDVACVAESAVGTTRLEALPDGSLKATATLPNIVVGSVGGGTGLPSQNACLRSMGLSGAGKARGLAEVAAALCLAGEISIVAAFCAHEFVSAHRKLARER